MTERWTWQNKNAQVPKEKQISSEKVECPLCKQKVKLLPSGAFPKHKDSPKGPYAWCKGPKS